MEQGFKITEVAVSLGCLVDTISNWYRWESEEHHSGKYLPVPTRQGRARTWTAGQIEQLREFKNSLKKENRGLMSHWNAIRFWGEAGKNRIENPKRNMKPPADL